MGKLMKEIEEKINKRKEYKMKMFQYPKDSVKYRTYDTLQQGIKDWLNKQVDLDLPVYFTRATFYAYMKSKEQENNIEVSQEDNKPFDTLYKMSFKAEELAATEPREKYLHVDKIKDLDDVKRRGSTTRATSKWR